MRLQGDGYSKHPAPRTWPIRQSTFLVVEHQGDQMSMPRFRISNRPRYTLGGLILSMLAAQGASAAPDDGYSLGTAASYNVLVFEDLRASPTITGPVAAGRDILAAGFGYNTSASGTTGAIAARTFQGSNGSVRRDVVYGVSQSLTNVGVIGGVVKQGTPLNFAAIKTSLDQYSQRLAGLPTNGTTSIASPTLVEFTGTDPALNVFRVEGSLLAAVDILRISVPSTSTAVINVTGSNVALETAGTQLGQLPAGNVIWNFLESTALRLSLMGIQGTVLATNAAITQSSATVGGAIYARSLVGGDSGISWIPFSGPDPFGLHPRFECVETRSNGSKLAVFGYENPRAEVQQVAVGPSNQFTPAPASRRQPTAFFPGTHRSQFAVGYSGTPPTWTLRGAVAPIVPTKACSTSFEVTTINDTTAKSVTPMASFGKATSLQVSTTEHSLIAFDRNTILTARGPARFVTRARLEVSRSSGGNPLLSMPMRKAWQETTATWNCANDLDASALQDRCHNLDSWTLPRKAGTWDNPYQSSITTTGTASGSKVSFDVTADVQRFLSEAHRSPIAWILQGSGSGSSVLGAREGNAPAKLVIETQAYADTDFAGGQPFSFAVDGSLTTGLTLPSFADGRVRRIAALKPSDSPLVRYAEDELLVLTDSASELNAIRTRLNATEIATGTQVIPGVPRLHLLRIDPNRGDPATLVHNIRRTVNRPDGEQKVSSDAALRLLAAAMDEYQRGTIVSVNWLTQPQGATIQDYARSTFTEGAAAPGETTETSSNTFDWDHFSPNMHDVNRAWGLLAFQGLIKPEVDVAIIDGGYAFRHVDLDLDTVTIVNCPASQCENAVPCDNGGDCTWHGTRVANAGFGRGNNLSGGAGPGADVADLTLVSGFGDFFSLLIEIPALVIGGEDIINISSVLPVPDYAFPSTALTEPILTAARQLDVVIFSAAGNFNNDVDERRCFNLLLGTVCPWEKVNWFPCETDGVNCVGATPYDSKTRAPKSNFGGSVRYFATGAALIGSSPDHPIGTQFLARSEGTCSLATAFISGTAALVQAAGGGGAGRIERCLSDAKSGGPNDSFVNTFLATACGMGGVPANLAPRVEITQPAGETATIPGIGLITLRANAADFESGVLNNIVWTSSVEGSIGVSSSGGPLLYTPTSPGLRTITARVTDPVGGAPATDTITLAITPSPPNVEILRPLEGANEIMGIPTDFVGRITNLPFPITQQPCNAISWTASVFDPTILNDRILFSSMSGCTLQTTFIAEGNHEARIDAFLPPLVGTGVAERRFNVISDGKLHVKIMSPALNPDLVPLRAELSTLPSMSLTGAHVGGSGTVRYSWTINERVALGQPPSITILTGPTAIFTPTPECRPRDFGISLVVVDDLGHVANHAVRATRPNPCQPP